jgi:hypothetical protein
VLALNLALVAGLGLVAASAAALSASSPPTLDLEYWRGSEAADCMGQGELRGRIRAELGYDPFASQDPTNRGETLRIQVGRPRGVLVADLELIGGDGNSLAQQRLRSSDASCTALGSAIEVAVSVMFDRVEEAPVALPTVEELLTLAPIPQISLPPEPPPPRTPVHLWTGALVAFAADWRPQLDVQASVRWPSWSLDLEGRYEPINSWDLTAQRGLVAIAPCLWSGASSGVAFCPVLMAGAVAVSGNNGQGGTLPELTTGARIAVSAPIFGPVALRLQGGVVFPLLNASVMVNGTELTESHTMTLDFGAGLSVRIL